MAHFAAGARTAPLGIHIEHAAQTPGTWAGGATRAIYADPPAAIHTPANARCWVGTALIERAAAYSFFPGRTRVHLPIQGNGIRLNFCDPAEVVTLATFAQHHFDGARPVSVELLDRPVVAFNVIFAAGVSAAAQILRFDRAAAVLAMPNLPAAPAQAAGATRVVRVVYAVAEAIGLLAAGQPLVRLAPGDAFVFGPHTVAAAADACRELQSLAAPAEAVVATLVFRTSA